MSDLMWTISNSLINVVDAFFLTMIPWTMTESKRKKRYAVATILILFFIRSRRKTPCFSYGDIRRSETKFLLKG